MLQGDFPLHWPLINSDHMRTRLAKRELEKKKVEDDQRWHLVALLALSTQQHGTITHNCCCCMLILPAAGIASVLSHAQAAERQ